MGSSKIFVSDHQACAIFVFCLVYSFGLNSATEEHCPPFKCGNLTFRYPFSENTRVGCGLSFIECLDNKPWIQLAEKGKIYRVMDIIDDNKTIVIRDGRIGVFAESGGLGTCHKVFNDFSKVNTSSSHLWFEVMSPNVTLFLCEGHVKASDPELRSYRSLFSYSNCTGNNSLFYYSGIKPSVIPAELSKKCEVFQLPVKEKLPDFNGTNSSSNQQLLSLLNAGFSLRWREPPDCNKCANRGVQCVYWGAGSGFACADDVNREVAKRRSKRRRTIGLCVGGACLVVAMIVLLSINQRLRKRRSSLTPFSHNMPSQQSSKAKMLKTQSTYFGAHVYSYGELEKATNSFDASRELGDGGFGTVYHGVLSDGQEVAVKRLYEHNIKRVEQFMNEIEILTHLCHENLVILYGCTSCHSRELLLVYEYISNGTVADHLHGEHSKLSWPIRMSIAIETASALSYLHASDIIHRDVKSSNILLDENFRVKVADFGLSRLFPADVSYVSTAPQGSPGYVDPRYYQCYQLTDKSDVYSFGVVLIELISSKPAVDITRSHEDINLSNFAMKKIQTGNLHELVDPNLGFESDFGVRRMISLVAELAFRCLQQDMGMRPCMDEVLEALEGIENEEHNAKKAEEVEIPPEDVETD